MVVTQLLGTFFVMPSVLVTQKESAKIARYDTEIDNSKY